MIEKIIDFIFALFIFSISGFIVFSFYMAIIHFSGHYDAKTVESATSWAAKNNIKPISVNCIDSTCQINDGTSFVHLKCNMKFCIIEKDNKVIENNMTCEVK